MICRFDVIRQMPLFTDELLRLVFIKKSEAQIIAIEPQANLNSLTNKSQISHLLNAFKSQPLVVKCLFVIIKQPPSPLRGKSV